MKGLRFDRVVKSLTSTLQQRLDDVVPDGKTLVITCTAPIRQPSKTAGEIEEKIMALIRSPRAAIDMRAVINGNDVRARLLKQAGAARVTVYVHNRDFDVEHLLAAKA